MSNPSYFSILTAEVRYSKEISDGEKILFSEITALTQKYGYCVASNGYFAKLYGLSKSAISNRINNLEKAGFIRCEIDEKNGNDRKIFLVISREKDYTSEMDTYTPQVETSTSTVETPIHDRCTPYTPQVDIYNNTSLSIQDLSGNLITTPLPSSRASDAGGKSPPLTPREKGTNPRTKKTNPRATGENPRKVSADTQAVFDFWKTTMGHPKARLDDKRKKTITTALSWEYSVADLCQAIDGCSKTPHNIGQNDRGQRYDGLHLILRDADQIDRFMANSVNPPRVLNKQEQIEAANLATLARYEANKAEGIYDL